MILQFVMHIFVTVLRSKFNFASLYTIQKCTSRRMDLVQRYSYKTIETNLILTKL
jgi:hypothetical protein